MQLPVLTCNKCRTITYTKNNYTGTEIGGDDQEQSRLYSYQTPQDKYSLCLVHTSPVAAYVCCYEYYEQQFYNIRNLYLERYSRNLKLSCGSIYIFTKNLYFSFLFLFHTLFSFKTIISIIMRHLNHSFHIHYINIIFIATIKCTHSNSSYLNY